MNIFNITLTNVIRIIPNYSYVKKTTNKRTYRELRFNILFMELEIKLTTR
jgi:hypothetical protein